MAQLVPLLTDLKSAEACLCGVCFGDLQLVSGCWRMVSLGL